MYAKYELTYSVGKDRYDETRYTKTVPAERLASAITVLQNQGKSIYSVKAVIF